MAAAASRAESALDAPHDWASELTELHASTQTASESNSPLPPVPSSPATDAAAAQSNGRETVRRPTSFDAADDAGAARAAAAQQKALKDSYAAANAGRAWTGGLESVSVGSDGSTTGFVPPSLREILQKEYVVRAVK